MTQRPSKEEIEKGLAEFRGNYKHILKNLTDCLEFDYDAIRALVKLLADSKEDIISVKRIIRPYIVNLLYVLVIDVDDLEGKGFEEDV